MSAMPDTDTTTRQIQDLSVRGLYLELSSARAAQIRRGTWHAGESPDAVAEPLMLAAVVLAHAAATAVASREDQARAAIVGFELLGEALRHDAGAGTFAERALEELDEAPDVGSAAFVREAADCLAWAAATLAQRAAHAGAGRHDLESLCLVEAAGLLAAADLLALHEAHAGA